MNIFPSPVLPKTTCVWWSMEILCTGVNSWREPRWGACAPSWNDRSPVWNIWNKVTEMFFTDLVFSMFAGLTMLQIFISASASVPFTHHWPQHKDPASLWLPKCGQVQLHQQGKIHSCGCMIFRISLKTIRYFLHTWICCDGPTSWCVSLLLCVSSLKVGMQKLYWCSVTVFFQVTRADVDVQPYAFTTKSLFVGHMDYRYLRWQVCNFSPDGWTFKEQHPWSEFSFFNYVCCWIMDPWVL